MRDGLVAVMEVLRDTVANLGTGKIFIGPPTTEQVGRAAYWVLDIANLESEFAGPSVTEWRAEVVVYRVSEPPAGKKGAEAKLSILDPLTDIRTWATDLITAGYVVEVRSSDLQFDRESDEREVVAAMALDVSWQECI